jgi:putative transposase
MSDQSSENVKRLRTKRTKALVLAILKEETSVAEAARKHDLRIAEIKEWKDRFLSGAENPLRRRPRNEEALKDEQLKRLKRWAMDLTHIHCGRDGWGHLAATIDCHGRELIGFKIGLRGRAREAERALEEACIGRFGTLRPTGLTPVVRSDNGLIFQSRQFRAVCRDYRVEQEYVTPYTPEQNGLIERFFCSLKEECVWQYRFKSFEEARRIVSKWIERYNTERLRQSIGYLSPREFREKES